MKTRLGLLIAVLLAAANVVFAHHSFAAEYDVNKPLALTGTVAKVAWLNPHTHLYIDVTDDKGTVTRWELEMGSPNSLEQRGWTRNSIKAGDEVFVEGYMAKDNPSLGFAKNIKLPDGRTLFAG
jgi:hypothetical protein